MNDDALKYAERLVPRSYIDLARQARRSHEQQIRQIIEHRKIPEQPLDENLIEQWLNEISQMDSNNFEGNIGVGEREGNRLFILINHILSSLGRIYSSLVARRHSSLSHGIGRSGDINAIQPKAAGSSLLNKLTNELVLDAIHILGLRTITHALVIPMATGRILVSFYILINTHMCVVLSFI
jgi:O-phospho-L-seryl-tRNASec:L-selenocysteinyl-tRNA synthase